MKAIYYTAYGNSDVLQLQESDKPACGENQVLIKITATTVNPFDIKVRSGAMREAVPISLPYIPGSDACGIVEEAGSATTRLKRGDEVFTTCFGGTYTEYVAVKEAQVAAKPNNVSANEAAALAVPLVTAYSFLVEAADLQKGQRILIHGAAGAVGYVMTQMAKALGAYVIGTASGEGVEMLKAIGTDEVIDYKAQDFTQLVKDADIVLDLVGGETQTKSFRVLKKGGKLLSTVAPPSPELAAQYGVSAQFLSSAPSHKKLEFGKRMVEEGIIKVHIAAVMPLADAAKAQDMVSAGKINGKVVLTVG